MMYSMDYERQRTISFRHDSNCVNWYGGYQGEPTFLRLSALLSILFRMVMNTSGSSFKASMKTQAGPAVWTWLISEGAVCRHQFYCIVSTSHEKSLPCLGFQASLVKLVPEVCLTILNSILVETSIPEVALLACPNGYADYLISIDDDIFSHQNAKLANVPLVLESREDFGISFLMLKRISNSLNIHS